MLGVCEKSSLIQVSNLIVMSLLPALILTTFNYLIYKKISRSRSVFSAKKSTPQFKFSA